MNTADFRRVALSLEGAEETVLAAGSSLLWLRKTGVMAT
jgi:hypothetical protein